MQVILYTISETLSENRRQVGLSSTTQHGLEGKRIRRKHAVFLFHSVTSLKLEVLLIQIIIHMTQFSKLLRYNQKWLVLKVGCAVPKMH